MGEKQGREKRGTELLRKWFRRDNLIVLTLLGILIFVIALPTEKKESGTQGKDSIFDFGDTVQKSSAEEGTGDTAVDDGEDYVALQERKLAGILSAVEGVGKVEVMLTITGSPKLVVEKDTNVSRSNTDERDSAGGSRSAAQVESGDTTVYRTADGASEPYVIQTMAPKVEGVLVVAEGAGTGTVNRYITQIVQALFGVEAHRVKVVPMG